MDSKKLAELVALELERIAQDPPISGNTLAQARVLMAARSIRDFGLSGAAPPAPQPAEAQPAERRPYGDLRHAKWLDPECYGAGACQSLRFKAAQPAEPVAQPTELLNALRAISLCSKNSMSSKEDCGRIARAALSAYERARSGT